MKIEEQVSYVDKRSSLSTPNCNLQKTKFYDIWHG
jgi:hypothetical protein